MLIFVQLVDRRVEIIVDRGIAAKVDQQEWDAICRKMEAAFARGDYAEGSIMAVRMAGEILRKHFPAIRAIRTNCRTGPCSRRYFSIAHDSARSAAALDVFQQSKRVELARWFAFVQTLDDEHRDRDEEAERDDHHVHRESDAISSA